MVTPINHVIAGTDFHRAGPLALWGFCKIFLPNIRKTKKNSYGFKVRPLAGTASYYGKSGPG